MLFRLLPRWETRQLIAASSFILLVACAEKPTAADALPLAPAQPAPVGDCARHNARRQH